MDGPAEYEFVVAGPIGARAIRILEVVQVVEVAADRTRLRAWIADQTALHGVLEGMRDLRVELVGFHRLP